LAPFTTAQLLNLAHVCYEQVTSIINIENLYRLHGLIPLPDMAQLKTKARWNISTQ